MNSPHKRWSRIPLGLLTATLALGTLTSVASGQGAYNVVNLVSDGSVTATATDPNFINPWGLSAGPTWWMSANVTGFNYVVGATAAISFKVIVPPAGSGTGQPTGSVSTKGASPFVLPNGTAASFLFSTTDGTISGWNSKLGTANAICQIAVNNSASNAVYTGLAMLTNSTGSFLLAPNFGAGAKVEVYNSTFQPTQLAGSFSDPSLPSGYAPYSIHVIGSQVFVAYAMRASAQPYRAIAGAGNGIVSVFDTNGNFVSRAVTGGNSNAPWGVAFAPATFGVYANDLLIGNFGDGTVNVYNPTTFAYLGQLMDGTGKSFVYPSLWDLQAGTSTQNGQSVGTVFFTSGLANETHGLFAEIFNNATATGTPTFGASAAFSSFTVTNGSAVQAVVSVAPTYNFSGTVSLSCTGLPLGVTCNFSPAQLSLTGTAPATTAVTIQTTRPFAAMNRTTNRSAALRGIAYALLLPLVSLLGFKRRGGVRMLSAVLVLLASVAWMSGCGDNSKNPNATPVGAQSFTIVAASGAISQQIPVTLNVQ
jgi:uncharacterized protein (TIGR03118 family)